MQKKEEQLEFLFKRISVKLNRSPDEFQPFIKILRDNWYDTQQSLRQIKDELFEQMKIPVRIVAAIRDELNPTSTQLQKAVQQQPNKRPQKIVLTQKNMMQLCQELQLKLTTLHNGNTEAVQPILKIVLRLVGNVSRDSYEMKYRHLKKSNKLISTNIIENPPCLDFMKSVGFVETEQMLQLHAVEVHEFIFLEECLSQMVEEKKVDNEPRYLKFTEFPETRDKGSLEDQFSQEKLSEMRYADALDKLLQYRNKLMSEPPKDRRLKLYHQRHDRKLKNFTQINLQTEFSKSDDEAIAGYWKNYILENRKNSHFQSKRKLEFEHLIKQEIYKEAIIKIKLPNEIIIEAVFGPLETLSAVFEFAARILIGDLYIFTAPPKKIMGKKQMGLTLYDLDAVPTGAFYIGSDQQFWIANEYANIIER